MIASFCPFDDLFVLGLAQDDEEIPREMSYAFSQNNRGRQRVAAFPEPGSFDYYREMDEAQAWCREQFGEPGERWAVSASGAFLCFRDQWDATAFRIRWG